MLAAPRGQRGQRGQRGRRGRDGQGRSGFGHALRAAHAGDLALQDRLSVATHDDALRHGGVIADLHYVVVSCLNLIEATASQKRNASAALRPSRRGITRNLASVSAASSHQSVLVRLPAAAPRPAPMARPMDALTAHRL